MKQIQLQTIYIYGEILWELEFDYLDMIESIINWMVCSWANMRVIMCFGYPQLKWMKQALLHRNLD